MPDGPVSDAVERTVRLSLGEQERHTGKCEEQLSRATSHHLVGAHPGGVDAYEPGESDCQEPDV